jgi:hypothetical protein
MPTKVDGVAATVKACKEGEVILLGECAIVLQEYPLQSISDISSGDARGSNEQQKSPSPKDA